MKKILLSLLVIASFAGYVIFKNQKQEINPGHIGINPQTTNTPTSSSSSATYKDGTYTGGVTDAFYGKYQVQAVIQNGKIADVVFLQYPNDVEHSQEVSAFANPALKQEAIAKQSANVDIISGATQTSEAFIQSLQSALDKAKI